MTSTFKTKLIFLFLGFLLGTVSIEFFGDNRLDNEWLFMVNSLENFNILSSRKINGELVPNIFMPPLYPLLLFIVKKIFFFLPNIYVKIILYIQLLLYLFSIKIFGNLLKEIFSSKHVINFGVILLLFFPLYIYAVGQISSIVLQVFLTILFIYNFVKFYKYNSSLNLFFFSIVSGLLILLRGEFFIFFFFTLIFLFLKNKNLGSLLTSLLITLLLISPYLIRNFKIFDTFALTKSTGFNLLKGNNPKSRVEGIGMWQGYDVVPELEIVLKEIKPVYKYDLLADKIFLNQAIKFIKQNPFYYAKLYLKKFISYLFIDVESTNPNYYSIMHILPKVVISIITIISILYFISAKINLFNYFALLYLLNGFILSFFFILPRYALSVLPFQIILSLFFIKKVYYFYKKMSLKNSSIILLLLSLIIIFVLTMIL